MGTIKTTDAVQGFGDANFYLMNPQGIIFGPKATLDIGGSFYATTANNIELADGEFFNAVPNQEVDSLLTSAPPEAFGFLGNSPPGPITIEESVLSVPAGETLSFVAGDISITGSPPFFPGFPPLPGEETIRTPFGQIHMVSLSNESQVTNISTSSGEVTAGQANGTIIISNATLSTFGSGIPPLNTKNQESVIAIKGGRLKAMDSFFFTSVSDTNQDAGNLNIDMATSFSLTNSQVTADSRDAGREGNIALHGGGTISLTNSLLSSANSMLNNPPSNKGIQNNRGGIILNASAVELTDHSELTTRSIGGQQGNDIHITGDNILIDNNSIVSTGTFGLSPSGDITIEAQETFKLSGASTLETNTPGQKNAGNINIKSPVLEVLEGASIQSVTAGIGDAGRISLNGQDRVIISGSSNNTPMSFPSRVSTQSIDFTSGKGGNILIEAGDFQLTKGGIVDSSTASQSQGGIVFIDANSISISSNGTSVNSETSGSGTGGTVRLDATQRIVVTGGASISTTSSQAGNAGNIILSAKHIVMDRRAQITSNSISQKSNAGGGGTIEVIATNSIDLTASKVSTSVEDGSKSGGNITLSAEQNVLLSGDTTITAESLGLGNAGAILIEAKNIVQVDNSRVTTQATKASGGDISLEATDMIRLKDSTIESSVQGNQTSAGGDISLDPQFVVLQNSRILATATSGFGGNIEIVGDVVLADPFSLAPANLSASSEAGPQFSGNVDIRAPIQNLSETIAPLPEAILKVSALFAARCAAQKGGTFSTFVQSAHALKPSLFLKFLTSPILEQNFSKIKFSDSHSTMAILKFSNIPSIECGELDFITS
ncbi:MAG: hypothetical protein NPIRA02_31780 [Nitrospirales bacterium]|nr:MAG: hypothetical protein NPIRA02_31780 [Nitrospirales bacterium]